MYTNTASVAKKISRMAEAKLAGLEYDVIFAPVGSGLVAHLRTSAPVVYLSDATVRLLLGYYDEFTGLFRFNVRMADELERGATTRASQLVYPSSWAARSAEDDYNADPSRINIVPFGANLDPAPSRSMALRPSATNRCQLALCRRRMAAKRRRHRIRDTLRTGAPGRAGRFDNCRMYSSPSGSASEPSCFSIS